MRTRATAGGRLTDYGSDYTSMAAAFRAHTDVDRHGLGQALAEFESAKAVVPPTPPTFRGRLGHVAIGVLSRPLWWVVRAFGLRDAVLRAMYNAMIEQRIELRELRARVEALENPPR